MLQVLSVMVLLTASLLKASKAYDIDIAAQLKKEPSGSCLKKQGQLKIGPLLSSHSKIKLEKMMEISHEIIESQKRSRGKKKNRKKKAAHAFHILQYAQDELKKVNKPGKSVHFSRDLRKKDLNAWLEQLPGYFAMQEEYDQFVMWQDSTQTQKLFVKLNKRCKRGECPKNCKKHTPIPKISAVSNYIPSKLGRSELKRNSVIFDMEIAYALNTLARILGLSDEEFERYKYAARIPGRQTFSTVIKVLGSFLNSSKNSTDVGLHKEGLIFKNIAKTWSQECRYTRILVRSPTDNVNKDQREKNFQAYTEQWMAKLQLHHERALIQIPEVISSGLFDPVKDLLQKRMTEALFLDEKSEVGIGFPPDQMAAVRRFFIGIKEFLYLPLSEDELAFLCQFCPIDEVDAASEVSTDYESSEEEIDIDEEYKPLDPDAPWDEEDEDPITE